jgi:hypothetical protein
MNRVASAIAYVIISQQYQRVWPAGKTVIPAFPLAPLGNPGKPKKIHSADLFRVLKHHA